ncbi:MAG TPA: TIGR04283 family arsenosugar biosynthesis glycosyltransferase [Candidatus Tectomicrobia bacterium]
MTPNKLSARHRPYPGISVVVPTLNEQEHLPATLARVALAAGDELIVVDGGSLDNTVAIAQQFTPCVLLSPPGRARQMNHGARQARGDVLLFLHADTLLPPQGLEAVRTVMQAPHLVGGAFRLAFTPSTPALRIIAWGANVRTRLGKLPYGDQALFVRRSLFEALGGYANVPFMEDVQLVQTLRQRGALAIVPQPVHTSGRRWLHDGVVYTTVRNNVLMALYFCGVPPVTLKRWYDYARRRTATT